MQLCLLLCRFANVLFILSVVTEVPVWKWRKANAELLKRQEIIKSERKIAEHIGTFVYCGLIIIVQIAITFGVVGVVPVKGLT
jgi:hypothetical protein